MALVLLYTVIIIFWAFWRRWLGGAWGDVPRVFKLGVAALFTMGVLLQAPPVGMVAAGILVPLYWTFGHPLKDNPSWVGFFLRYGPPGLAWPICWQVLDGRRKWSEPAEYLAGAIFGVIFAVMLYLVPPG